MFAVWLLSLLKAPFSSRRYALLSPPSAKTMLILDKVKKAVISLNSRGPVDHAIFRDVYYSQVCELSHLSRYADLCAHYQAILAEGKTPLILDLGANIGVTTRYMCDLFPQSKLIAYEPDSENAQMAAKNCEQADIRIAAVAGQDGKCDYLDKGVNPNGYSFTPTQDGAVNMVSMATINAEIDEKAYVPFIMKVDIEGSEAELFEQASWVAKWPVMMVELHDWLHTKKAVSRSFLASVSQDERDTVIGDGVFISLSNQLF